MPDTSTKPAGHTPPPWLRALGLMSALQILATASVLALTALAPLVAADIGVGAHWIGYQISLIYFAGMFASALAGAFVAAVGTRSVIVVEILCFGVGLVLLGSGHFALMVMSSLFFGVGYGLNNPAASEILDGVVPRARRNVIFSIKQSGVPLGAIVASLLLPALALGFGGWQGAVLAFSLASVAMLVAVLVFLPRLGRPRRRIAPAAIAAGLVADQRTVLQQPDLRALTLIGGLFSACQLMVTAFAILTLVAAGWSPVAAGSVAAGLHAAGAVGRVFWGAVADKAGCFAVLAVIGMLIAGLSLAVLWLDHVPPVAQVVVFAGLGFVASGWNGVALAGIAQTAPAGQVSGTTGAALVYTFLGVIAGPSLFAALYGQIGAYQTCFVLVVLCGLAGAALAYGRMRGGLALH